MSETKFKAVLQKVLSDAVAQNRDALLAAFMPLADDAMARQVEASNFTRLVWSAVRDTFDTTLHSTLTGHIRATLDRLIVERLAEPEVQNMIYTQAREWVASSDFEELITERTAIHLRALLASRVPDDLDDRDDD